MVVLIVAALLAALVAAGALPLLVIWACAEGRDGEPPPRRAVFNIGFLRRSGLLRVFGIGGTRPPLLTYRRDERGRFRKVARG